MQQISFKVDGYRLAGAVFYPEKLKEKNPAILFVHGWTSEKERSYQYAESLSELGYMCMLFDMRGHGKSEGDIKKITIREFLDDVIAAYDYLSDVKGVGSEHISAIGSSFGGYLIAQLSEKRKVKNLALRVPADYPNEDFDKSKFLQSGSESPEMVAWRNQAKKNTDTFALQAINSFTGDVLIIESEKDHIVPRRSIQNYINAINDKSKLTHVVIKDAPHTIEEGKFRDEVANILTSWFKTKI